MTEHARGWGPLFLTGMAIAVVAEMALGLLVYQQPGLLSALTIVLAVEIGALAAGIATRPPLGERGGRWRWFASLATLILAGFATILWSVNADFTTDWMRRGGALTILGALPLYGLGLLISAVPPRGDRSQGTAILVGALLGVVLFGTTLVARVQPTGIYLFAILCVSTAALLTGSDAARAALRRAGVEMGQSFVADAPNEHVRLLVTPAEAWAGDEILGPEDIAPEVVIDIAELLADPADP